MVSKQTLRAVYLEKRKFLAEDVYQQYNARIYAHLMAHFADKLTGYVHVFLPIASQREVDTWPIIHWLWERGASVLTSRTLMGENKLLHLPLTPETQLTKNKWGIFEPSVGETVDPTVINTVLVPLVTFDRSGNRIGYGKGYYDRFLRECHPSVFKLGLSLSPPLDNIDYVEPTDIALDACVTPIGIYQFDHGKT